LLWNAEPPSLIQTEPSPACTQTEHQLGSAIPWMHSLTQRASARFEKK
jgi:hypothetical protein